jgi:sigma-B regulation protein RsbU (phosphoserine phosphatase)
MITMALESCGADLVGVMQAINRAYCRRLGSMGSFATLLAAVLNPARHRVRAVNAGHAPALIRAQGNVRDLVPRQQMGMPLGVYEQVDYEEVATELGVGDAVFVASDAVPDALSPRHELYGLDRLEGMLAAAEASATDVGRAALADLKAFIGTGVMPDDLTAVCFVRDS